MENTPGPSSAEVVIATIANRKNPAQVIEIVHLPEEELFITRGIAANFYLKEIAVPQGLMLADIDEITQVISYLLEKIATAADLHLPFHYDEDFQVSGRSYHLDTEGEVVMLGRASH